MTRWVALGSVALAAAACSVEEYDYDKVTVGIEVISPPVQGGGVPIFAANGPIMLGQYITEDSGATWAGINPAIIPSIAQAPNDHEFIVQTTQFGLGRWYMDTDQVTAIPSLGSPGAWHVRPATDTFLMHINGTNDFGRQIGVNGAMTRVPIPMPPGGQPTQVGAIAISSNATVAVMTSFWGQYRSLDDGQSWEFVSAMVPGAQEWHVLPDGRFILFTQNRVGEIFDAMGLPTGQQTAVFPTSTSARISCLGAIFEDQQFTRDLGMTWEPILPMQMDQTFHVATYTCGGDYVAIYVDTPVKLILKQTVLGQLGAGINSPVPEPVAVTDAFRSTAGTWFGGNYAWKEGDAAWSLRFLPEAKFFALADGSLLGLDGTTIYRSRDDGMTFESATVPTAPVQPTGVFASADGTLWATRAGGTSNGAMQLLRSTDDGETWEDVYPSFSSERPELVAIADDGTFVGRGSGTELFVSHDQAATWEALPFPTPYQLAFVTHSGDAVTWDVPGDDGELGHVWHLWRDYGLGAAYRQVIPTMQVPSTTDPSMMMDINVELGDSGRFPTLDAQDHVYLFGGGTLQGVFKSTAPLSRE